MKTARYQMNMFTIDPNGNVVRPILNVTFDVCDRVSGLYMSFPELPAHEASEKPEASGSPKPKRKYTRKVKAEGKSPSVPLKNKGEACIAPKKRGRKPKKQPSQAPKKSFAGRRSPEEMHRKFKEMDEKRNDVALIPGGPAIKV